jgi:hypothetical protein
MHAKPETKSNPNAPRAVLAIAIVLIVGGGIYWFANQSGGGLPEPVASSDSKTAASEGLATFRQLITEDNYRGLGLDSLDQVAALALGDPMPVYRIQLDQLLAFKQGDDPNNLLVDDQRVTYPVVADTLVVSSLSVAKGADGWRATDYGNSNVVKALSLVRKDTSDFIVQIPALKLYFIGTRRDGVLFLTAAADHPLFGFVTGKTIAAESAILVIQPIAAQYNGLPE